MAKLFFLVLLVVATTHSFVRAFSPYRYGHLSGAENVASQLEACKAERDTMAKKLTAWKDLVKAVEEEMLSRAKATGEAITTLQELMRKKDSRRGETGGAETARDHFHGNSGLKSHPNWREEEEKKAKVEATSQDLAKNLMAGEEKSTDQEHVKKEALEDSVLAKLQALSEMLSETN